MTTSRAGEHRNDPSPVRLLAGAVRVRDGGGSPAAASRPQGINLLRVPGVRASVRWRGFPYVFQLAMLAVFVALAVVAWDVHAPPDVDAKLYAKANLVTLVIWGIWWPMMVWTAVWLGRAWCMVCPLELVSNASERLAKGVGVPQRPLRKAVASGTVIVAVYALVQLLVAGAHINRVPAYTSLLLLGLLATALLTGVLFKDRAFCRGFCPVGLLLGTYGRGGMLAVRARESASCQRCTGKECVASSNRSRLDARSCPSLLSPARLRSNKDCLLCGQCLKACQQGNMQLLLRRPFPSTDLRDASASWPVTAFVMLVSGFVIWELFTEWPAAESVFLAAPALFTNALGWRAAAGWFDGLWALAVVPLLLWTALAGLVRLFGEREPLGVIWQRMALPMAVVVSAGHMSKGLAKLASWAPFLPRALHDPTGLSTVRALTTGMLPLPVPYLGLPVVATVGVALVLLALWYAIREHRLACAPAPLQVRAIIPVAVVASAFILAFAGWMVNGAW